MTTCFSAAGCLRSMPRESAMRRFKEWKWRENQSKKCAALVPDIRVCSIQVITVCDCTSSRFLVPVEMAVAALIILAALLLDSFLLLLSTRVKYRRHSI
jgi:hypothetical protein